MNITPHRLQPGAPIGISWEDLIEIWMEIQHWKGWPQKGHTNTFGMEISRAKHKGYLPWKHMDNFYFYLEWYDDCRRHSQAIFWNLTCTESLYGFKGNIYCSSGWNCIERNGKKENEENRERKETKEDTYLGIESGTQMPSNRIDDKWKIQMLDRCHSSNVRLSALYFLRSLSFPCSLCNSSQNCSKYFLWIHIDFLYTPSSKK